MRKNVYVGSETQYNSSSLTHGRPPGSKNKDVKYIAIDPKTGRYIYENSSLTSPSKSVEKTAYKKSDWKKPPKDASKSDYEKWQKDRIDRIKEQVANAKLGPEDKAKKGKGKGGGGKGKGGGGKAKEEKPPKEQQAAQPAQNQPNQEPQHAQEQKQELSKVDTCSEIIKLLAKEMGISSYTSQSTETVSGLTFSINAPPDKTQEMIDNLKRAGYYMTGNDTANGVEISVIISPKN